MTKRSTVTLGIAGFAAFMLTACGSSTRLTNVWSDPASPPSAFTKLMVISVAKNATIRRLFEDHFVAALKTRGFEASPSYALVGDGDLDSGQVSSQMHKSRCDGVFVTRIIDQRSVKTYYPASYSYRRAPDPYYRGWYSYYSLGYAYVGTPGYTVENQIVNMETNLYRVADGALVWSALSRTWLQPSEAPGDDIDPLIRQLVDALSKSTVVERNKG